MTTNPITVKRILAANLTAARKKHKMVQKQVAGRAGIPRSTYASYEEGRAEPPLVILFKIAEALNTPIGALLDENADDIRLSER